MAGAAEEVEGVNIRDAMPDRFKKDFDRYLERIKEKDRMKDI